MMLVSPKRSVRRATKNRTTNTATANTDITEPICVAVRRISEPSTGITNPYKSHPTVMNDAETNVLRTPGIASNSRAPPVVVAGRAIDAGRRTRLGLAKAIAANTGSTASTANVAR